MTGISGPLAGVEITATPSEPPLETIPMVTVTPLPRSDGVTASFEEVKDPSEVKPSFYMVYPDFSLPLDVKHESLIKKTEEIWEKAWRYIQKKDPTCDLADMRVNFSHFYIACTNSKGEEVTIASKEFDQEIVPLMQDVRKISKELFQITHWPVVPGSDCNRAVGGEKPLAVHSSRWQALFPKTTEDFFRKGHFQEMITHLGLRGKEDESRKTIEQADRFIHHLKQAVQKEHDDWGKKIKDTDSPQNRKLFKEQQKKLKFFTGDINLFAVFWAIQLGEKNGTSLAHPDLTKISEGVECVFKGWNKKANKDDRSLTKRLPLVGEDPKPQEDWDLHIKAFAHDVAELTIEDRMELLKRLQLTERGHMKGVSLEQFVVRNIRNLFKEDFDVDTALRELDVGLVGKGSDSLVFQSLQNAVKAAREAAQSEPE